MTHDECMKMLIYARLNYIQALHVADAIMQSGISWTYLPSGVRRSLYPLIEHRILKITSKAIDGDTQIYEWVGVTSEGLDILQGRMK
jgi:hypothetical protein